jgi:Phage Mu protein F like protein
MATNRDIEQLISDWTPRLRAAFLKSIADIANSAQIGVIASKLEAGDIEGAIRAVGIDPVKFRALDVAIGQAFEQGGQATAAGMPARRDAGEAVIKILFDVRNIRAERYLKEHSSTLVREIITDQQDMIRTHLTKGMTEGAGPRQVALDLVGRIQPNGKRSGGAVGLTSSQEEWVSNYRAKLSDPARIKEALENNLRDKRFDRTLNSAIKNGKGLSPEAIDAMVTSYRNRALKYRGDAIGRTEAIRSLNQSQLEAARQAIDAGQVDSQAVTKKWLATKDNRTRDTHQSLNGQEVGINEMFVSKSGARLAYPGDPNAPAAETINCRCTYTIKTNFLRGLQ